MRKSWYFFKNIPYRRPGLWSQAITGRVQLIPFHYLGTDLLEGRETQKISNSKVYSESHFLYLLYLCHRENTSGPVTMILCTYTALLLAAWTTTPGCHLSRSLVQQ
jgi:hypothetical protein